MPYYLPTSIDEALTAAVASGGDFAYVAGGTDQMVQRAQGTARRAHLIDLTRITAMHQIATGDTTRIGAGVTLAALTRHAELGKRYPALVDGAFIIIAWVGFKLLVEYLHSAGYVAFEIPKWLSLGLIVVIFLIALGYSFVNERRGQRS